MKKNTLSDRLFVTALTKYIVYTKPWILCLGQSHTHTHIQHSHTHTHREKINVIVCTGGITGKYKKCNEEQQN
jgi:hypothetical protein